jgi:hypothetical protein
MEEIMKYVEEDLKSDKKWTRYLNIW